MDAQCRYLAPVTFGDHIRVRIRLEELRPRVATMAFTIDRMRDGARAAEGRVLFVCVRRGTGPGAAAAIELPSTFRQIFAPLVVTDPVT